MKNCIRRAIMTIVLVVLAAVVTVKRPGATGPTYTCDGQVTMVAIYPSGSVEMTLGSLNSVFLCQVGATNNGYTSEACKAAYAMLLSAKTSGAMAHMQMSDNLTCSTHPQFVALTGIYGGPFLY